jgi:DNA repair protein RecN (Recombination protein N)
VLEALTISHLALIDRLSLTFSEGLTVLTGETGAGKSILIKAVNLLMGERPTPDTVRQGAEEARIEALFTVPPDHPLRPILEEAGIRVDDQVVVRRVIQGNGKSRAWINESVVGQGLLAKVTRRLIGVSNQHESQSLLNPAQHLYLLDRFGGLLALREKVQRRYEALEDLIQERRRLLEEEAKKKEQEDLWRFQLREIQEADLKPGEEEELRRERRVLQQGEKLLEKVRQTREILSEEDRSCLSALFSARDLLRSAASWDERLQPLAQELETLRLQVNEISASLGDYLSRLEVDPERLVTVENRLERIHRLKAKYGSTEEDVLRYGREIEEALSRGESRVWRRREVEEAIALEKERLYEDSRELSQKRKKAALMLAARVERELEDLGMKGCRFETVFSETAGEDQAQEEWRHQGVILGKTGLEKGEFFIAPNPGEGSRPLIRIASGGELSRILLVLKKLLSRQDALETLIFDEVDVGIGGSLGEAVGKKLWELSRSHQVLCITHLPQIAAFADTHFQVHKTVSGQRTLTRIRPLNQEERVAELARMLGGESPSTETFALAGELLKRAGKH